MTDYWKDYYAQLDGATIVKYLGIVKDEIDSYGKPFPLFAVVLKDGTKVQLEISQDEEGNGGGFIFGLPLPLPVGRPPTVADIKIV